jgi:hypothetical protein
MPTMLHICIKSQVAKAWELSNIAILFGYWEAVDKR